MSNTNTTAPVASKSTASVSGVTTPAKAKKAAKVTPQVPALPGTAPLGIAAKAAPAPAAKASPPAIKSKVAVKPGSTLIAYEPGILTIKLSEIDSTPADNLTRPEWADLSKDEKDLRELAAQIEEVGQQAPIVVQRVKGGSHPFRMAAGYRRFAAITLLKRDTIEARVEASGTDEARILVNITENENARKATTAMGKLAGIEALAALGHSPAEVAKITGYAEDFVRDLMRISKTAEEIRAALSLPEGTEGFVSFGVARQVMRLTGTQDMSAKEEQLYAFKRIKNLSVEATRAWLKNYRLTKDGGGVTDEDEEGEGEGKGKASKDDSDPVYPEVRVVKSTMPFLVKYLDAQSAMISAVEEMQKAALALDHKGIAAAVKQMEQAVSLLDKGINQQTTALTKLFDEKAFTFYFKAAKKDAAE